MGGVIFLCIVRTPGLGAVVRLVLLSGWLFAFLGSAQAV